MTIVTRTVKKCFHWTGGLVDASAFAEPGVQGVFFKLPTATEFIDLNFVHMKHEKGGLNIALFYIYVEVKVEVEVIVEN